jgi:hypothetical protein
MYTGLNFTGFLFFIFIFASLQIFSRRHFEMEKTSNIWQELSLFFILKIFLKKIMNYFIILF